MLKIKGYDLALTRGDTMSMELSLTYGGEPYTLEDGDSVKFALKSRLNASRTEYVETDPIIEKSFDLATMTMTLVPSDTKLLPFGTYHYDVQVTFASGAVDTVINNAIFEILPEVA